MKILLIEDDDNTTALVLKALTAYDFQIEASSDGQTGLELAKTFDYDLLLLDVMLPKLDGISLCRQLRLEGYQVPIMMLTVMDGTNFRVMGLEAGADDYLVKPFVVSELIARIRALLRRGRTVIPQVLIWESLQLNTNTREVTYDQKQLHLTPKEYGLLELFLRNPRRIFSRSDLLNRIWSSSECPGEEAVTTQIKGLRQKLKTVGMAADLIETIYGLGYRLKEKKTEVDLNKDAPSSIEQKHQEKPSNDLTDHLYFTEKIPDQAQIIAAVAKTWAGFRENCLGKQMVLFEQLLKHLAKANLDNHLLEQAQIEAHRLAGSLGCYGLTEGSKLAREIEILVQDLTNWQQNISPRSERLEALVKLLKETVQQQRSPLINLMTSPPNPLTKLLVIDNDTAFIQQIQANAASWNFQVKVASDMTETSRVLSVYSPDAVLVDLTSFHLEPNDLLFLADLKEKKPELSVIVFTIHKYLCQRIQTSDLGVYSFVHKTMTISEVFSVIKTSLETHSQSKAPVEKTKVMVVDDDPHILHQLNIILLSWGVQVTTLQYPLHFWEILEVTHPDLLILDVEMPDCNGIELCQTVRNNHSWNHLPILLLSTHLDSETLNQGYTVGADDYLHKPILEPELFTRILNAIKQMQVK